MSFVPGSKFVKKYAFFFDIPDRLKLDPAALAEACRAHFSQLELNDSIILEFSRYTRAIAGDDLDQDINEELENERYRQASEAWQEQKRSRLLHPILHPIAPEGSKVVALIDNEWIHATVLKYFDRRQVYKVQDCDESTARGADYEVMREYVIPLPYRGDRFRPGERVLAMYPGTTTFYPATICRMIKRSFLTFDYSLMFDGDEEDPDSGEIRQKVVKGDLVTVE